MERLIAYLEDRVGRVSGAEVISLAVVVLALFLLVGVVHEWRHGSGSGTEIAGIVWRVVWIVYQAFKTLLIVLLIYLGYRYLQARRGRLQG